MNLSIKEASGKICPVVIGGGVAALVAVISQAAPHVVRFGADQMVSLALHPQRASEPQQWEWVRVHREPLEVAVSDGTILRGFFIPAQASTPVGTVVILHGHMSCADQMAWFAEQAVKARFNAVVYDARAHGESGGNVCSFGIHEAGDAKQIARQVGESHPGPVFLWGISMGAAVGAQALASETPFSGGVLFSPFSNLDAMISATLAERGLWWVPGLTGDIRSRIQEVIGVPPSEVSPVAAAANIRVPVLVVHGERDTKIPVAQGNAVFHAIPGSNKEFLQLPDAGHDDMVAMEKLWGKSTLRRVFSFLQDAQSRNRQNNLLAHSKPKKI